MWDNDPYCDAGMEIEGNRMIRIDMPCRGGVEIECGVRVKHFAVLVDGGLAMADK